MNNLKYNMDNTVTLRKRLLNGKITSIFSNSLEQLGSYNSCNNTNYKKDISKSVYDTVMPVVQDIANIIKNKEFTLLEGTFRFGACPMPLFTLIDMLYLTCKYMHCPLSLNDINTFENVLSSLRNLDNTSLIHSDWHINPSLPSAI